MQKLHNAHLTMRKKLLYYMLLLAILLLFALFLGISFLGGINSGDKDIHKTLNFQIEVFEKDMLAYVESLAASSILIYLAMFLTSLKMMTNLSVNAFKISPIIQTK